ncbi:ATP-binding protein [Nonomuraea sp. NPDC049784]|uniref:ATP-binding protein n=1 Tax=Nonomuraea sp. NPDC049784 TaxID=3154361 RepID=UPI0033D2D1D4
MIAAIRAGLAPLLVMLCLVETAAGGILLALSLSREREQRRLLADLTSLRASQDRLRASTNAREHALRVEASEREQRWRDHCTGMVAAIHRLVTHLLDERIPAAISGGPVPAAPSEPQAGPDVAKTLDGVVDAVSESVGTLADQKEALRQVLVALARRVQPSAHRIQEVATRLADARIGDDLVQESMMRIDHAAAQQARAAQSLAVLCHEWPGQQWPYPTAFVDVVRAASGRILDYRRIKVLGDATLAAAASVVEQLIHLVAELLANATACSPPNTMVEVEVRQVQRGAVITIDDGGVGLDEHRLAKYNAIASGERLPELEDMVDALQTGLLVVGNLASRHNFRVSLTHSAFGGVRAVVLVPEELIEILDQETASRLGPLGPPMEIAPDGNRGALGTAMVSGATGGSSAAANGLPQRRSPRRSAAQVGEPRPPAPPVPARELPHDPTDFIGGYLEAIQQPPIHAPDSVPQKEKP